MVCPGLIPKDGTAYAKCLSSKLTSYIAAYMNLIICTIHLFTIIFRPSSLGPIYETMSKTEVTVAVLLSISLVIFAVILLIGLHKNRRLFIMSFLIFCGVYIVWVLIGTLIILFTNPSLLGFRGFVYNIFSILIYIGFFCVIKYYSSTTFT